MNLILLLLTINFNQLPKSISMVSPCSQFPKRIFLCLLLISANWFCLAQEKELTATIETNDGLKTEGYILIRPPHINNELISFRNSTNSTYQEYFPKQLKSYTLAGDLYESHVFDSTSHFFLVLVKGEASLYELSDQKKRYYIQMQNEDKVYWLRHEKMVIANDGYQKTVKLISYYKEILTRKLVGCSSLDSLKLPNPSEKELKAYITTYNKCFSGNNYELKELKKQLFLGISSGILSSSNNYFSMGATLDFKNPRKKLLLTSLAYNHTRWEEWDDKVKIVNRIHWISYRVNLILFPNKLIEPFVLFDTSMGLTDGSGYGIAILPFYFWSGGGLKINFGKKAFSRVTYTFPIALRDWSFPSSLNLSVSYRVR